MCLSCEQKAQQRGSSPPGATSSVQSQMTTPQLTGGSTAPIFHPHPLYRGPPGPQACQLWQKQPALGAWRCGDLDNSLALPGPQFPFL